MKLPANKIRALIVDDEPLARQGVRMLLEKDPQIGLIREACSGKQAVHEILGEEQDLVFLDVQMPEMDGFGVLRKVGLEKAPIVVFVTAYDKYAIAAFEINAVDYLLKPLSTRRFKQALGRAKLRLGRLDRAPDYKIMALLEQLANGNGYLQRLAVKSGDRTVFLSMNDVDWIQADANYVRLHAAGSHYLLETTMNRISERLDPVFFVRVHRSLIVNVDRIREVQRGAHGEYVLILKNGIQLQSGRTYSDAMKRLLSNPL